jgi:hypothetical protein
MSHACGDLHWMVSYVGLRHYAITGQSVEGLGASSLRTTRTSGNQCSGRAGQAKSLNAVFQSDKPFDDSESSSLSLLWLFVLLYL